MAAPIPSNGVYLNYLHAFGLGGGVKGAAHFISDSSVAYQTGRHLAFYNLETKETDFIVQPDRVASITALAVDLNRRYIAVCERTISLSSPATVTVYNTATPKKKRMLSHSDISPGQNGHREFIAASFSPDSKHLLTLSCGPDFALVYWHWYQTKVVNVVKLSQEIISMSFNSWDNSQFATSGPGHLRFWKIMEGSLKSSNAVIGKREVANYTAHAWAPADRLLAATANASVHVFDQSELKHVISNIWPDRSITSLEVYGGGFLVASDEGALTFYEKTDLREKIQEKEPYLHFKSFYAGDNNHVSWTSLSPSGNSLVCVLNDAELATFPIGNVDILPEDLPESHGGAHLRKQTLVEVDEEEESGKQTRIAPGAQSATTVTSYNQTMCGHFTLVGGGSHRGAIVSMDVAVRKPLLVTAGADRSVRIWNYYDRICEVKKAFSEEIFSTSFHPSGFHVLVGQSDKLRLFDVLLDDLKLAQEFPVKSCRESKFSRGGQYFAATNGHSVAVFNTYTGEKLCSLDSHTSLVTGLHWSGDDSGLATSGKDGAVYEWAVRAQPERLQDNVIRGCNYSDVTYASTSGTSSLRMSSNSSGSSGGGAAAATLIAVGSDGVVREICRSNVVRELPLLNTGELSEVKDGKEKESKDKTVREKSKISVNRITQCRMALKDRSLIVSTQGGLLRAFTWGLHTLQTEPINVDYHPHGIGAITRLCVSPDGCTLFSAGEDGCVFLFDVHAMENGEPLPRRITEPSAFSDVVLTTRAEVEEKLQIMQEMEGKVNEMHIQTEYKLHLHDQEWHERMKKLKDESEAAVRDVEKRLEAVRRRKEKQELEAAESLASMERSHMKGAEELESLYEKKLALEAKKYVQLVQEKEDLECSHDEQLIRLSEQHANELAGLRQEMQGKQTDMQESLDKVEQKDRRAELAMTKLQYDEHLRQQEAEYEEEIAKLKSKHGQELGEQRSLAIQMKTQASAMKNRFEKFESELSDLREELKAKKKEISGQAEEITTLERNIRMLRKDIQEREETLDAKEKRIAELRFKVKELEKIRFVLDYKYKELKKDVEPKVEAIDKMKSQIHEMDHELERDARQAQQQKQTMSDMKLKVDNLTRELGKQRRLVTEIDPEDYREALKQLYHTYSKKARGTLPTTEKDALEEFARQREYMERSLKTLKKRARKDEEAMKQGMQRKASENAVLIDELNALRKENKTLTQRLTHLEGAMRTRESLYGDAFSSAGTSAPPSRAATAMAALQVDRGASAGSGGRPVSRGGAKTAEPSSGVVGRLMKGSALAFSEGVASDRSKVVLMLQQLEENNREIQHQREEISRLRRQVHLLLEGNAAAEMGLPLIGEGPRKEEIEAESSEEYDQRRPERGAKAGEEGGDDSDREDSTAPQRTSFPSGSTTPLSALSHAPTNSLSGRSLLPKRPPPVLPPAASSNRSRASADGRRSEDRRISSRSSSAASPFPRPSTAPDK